MWKCSAFRRPCCALERGEEGEEKSTAGLLCKVHSPLSWERHSPLARAVLPRGSLSAGPVRVRWRSSVGCRFLTSFYSAITLRVIASIKLERYTVWLGEAGWLSVDSPVYFPCVCWGRGGMRVVPCSGNGGCVRIVQCMRKVPCPISLMHTASGVNFCHM